MPARHEISTVPMSRYSYAHHSSTKGASSMLVSNGGVPADANHKNKELVQKAAALKFTVKKS